MRGKLFIKDSLKQFLLLLMIGQIFLLGAALRDTDVPDDGQESEAPAHIIMTPPVPQLREKSLPQKLKEILQEDRSGTEVKIAGISQRGAEPYCSLEFDLEKPIEIVAKNHAEKFLRIQVKPTLSGLSPQAQREITSSFNKFSFYRGLKFTEILFYGKGPIGEPTLKTLANGQTRLTIPFRKNDIVFPLACDEIIEDGFRYYHDRVPTEKGFAEVFILRVNPTLSSLNIFPVLANEGICQKEVLSSMARRYQAIGGINGAYFTNRGDPIGTLVINRRLISSPTFNRSVFGLTRENKPLFGNPDFSGSLSWENLRLEIDGINQPRTEGKLTIFTPEYARSTLTTEEGKELVVVKNRVIRIEEVNALIPPDGIVVSTGGQKAEMLSKVRLGDQIDLNYHVSSPWDRIQHAVCGGPRLISEGRIDINGHAEHFDDSIRFGRHPRTAIALSFNGDLLFVVVDGRSKISTGMKLIELANYLKKLGARYAINMDGGGSSSLFVRGRIVNHPSDGKERPISNGILITKN